MKKLILKQVDTIGKNFKVVSTEGTIEWAIGSYLSNTDVKSIIGRNGNPKVKVVIK